MRISPLALCTLALLTAQDLDRQATANSSPVTASESELNQLPTSNAAASTNSTVEIASPEAFTTAKAEFSIATPSSNELLKPSAIHRSDYSPPRLNSVNRFLQSLMQN